jgi:hypothetical protein
MPAVARAVNLHDGEVTNRAVAETFGLPLRTSFTTDGAMP